MTIRELSFLYSQARDAGQETDGTTSAEELSFLAALACPMDILRVAEIGFNAGYSSYTFLAANPEARVWSFDLARYAYSEPAKQHIDECFPGRHTLVRGDSTETVPRYRRENPTDTFDLIFIDGGHDYDVVMADIRNMRELAADLTMVVIDDLTPWKPWGRGPDRAWRDAQDEGIVDQVLLMQDGIPVNEAVAYSMESRVWALGTYRRVTS